MRDQRRAVVRMSAQLLSDVLTGVALVRLPPGSTVTQVHDDYAIDGVALLVTNPAFPPVAEHAEAPPLLLVESHARIFSAELPT